MLPKEMHKGRARMARTAALATLVALAVAATPAACPAPFPASLAGSETNALEAKEPCGPDEFPHIDWGYWLGVNPDIVGWVSVPGTGIDHPIVQARPDVPEFYLSHGIDRGADARGCPFLDADCLEGLDSTRCVVYGHNWNGREMFSDFARFSDAGFAEAHSVVLLQTPESRRRLSVRCVEVAKGADDTNVTSFRDAEEFRCWYQSRYAASRVRLDGAPAEAETPDNVYTFCTCSYSRWENERTLVYAAEERPM